ncbi:Unknown protein [Striga hermonthica]|uniref:Uncharacterized protein n=1 Tax=Striga hermonthica TaxID=68872 RepID=A0A9N7RES6_STRHE|nr:Unknown protein [Striga hermonthica]
MALLNRANAYSKIENEDPEETKHRLAQFLIYKAMQKADSDARRRPSRLRVKMIKLKVKIVAVQSVGGMRHHPDRCKPSTSVESTTPPQTDQSPSPDSRPYFSPFTRPRP